MSPRDGLRHLRAMHCDIPERWIVTRHPSPLISGHRVSPIRLVPALQLSKVARFGVSCKAAVGAGVVLGQLFTAALSARPQSRRRIFPGPASFRQPGQPGGALAAAEVSWEGKPGPGAGSWEGFLLEGPGRFFHLSLDQRMTTAPLPVLARHPLLQRHREGAARHPQLPPAHHSTWRAWPRSWRTAAQYAWTAGRRPAT